MLEENKGFIVILGAGESGVGSAVLAKAKGFRVFVSDSGQIKDNYRKLLIEHEISWEEQQHSIDKIIKADEVIKSPGIPEDVSIIKILENNGIPVISEIEFACRYTNAKLIGVTGSNGKTTTSLLIYDLLKAEGYSVGLAGNVGKSFAMQVAQYNYDFFVLELSSFQLDGMKNAKINTALLLNITPDHLNRYNNDLSLYIRSKFKITNNQTSQDHFIFNWDDKVIKDEIQNINIQSKMIPFSIKEKLPEGGCVEENNMHVLYGNSDFFMPVNELSLKGKHNLANSMAAGITARIHEVKKETIRERLSKFVNIAHRLEYVSTIRGVDYINDSKATNVNSAWYAIEYVKTPVIWLAGGVDKGNDYEELSDIVRDKVKAIICIGKDNIKLKQFFGNEVSEVREARSMKEAVELSYQIAEKGDTVLLSPACASFDLFANYQDRGEQFKNFVKLL